MTSLTISIRHMACHQRSTSLPSKPHSNETKVEEELHSINASISSPFVTIETICDSLRRLEGVYNGIEEVICMPSNQVGLSQPQQRKLVEEKLERSVELLDLCNAMQEIFLELKMSIREILLVLKRGEDAAVQVKMQSYVRLVKKATSHFKKIGTKSTSDKQDCNLLRLLTEARELTVSLLKSTLNLLTKQFSLPNASKWCRISKKFQRRKVACDEAQFQALEFNIGNLECTIEFLFRRLIQSRVSLLNILSS